GQVYPAKGLNRGRRIRFADTNSYLAATASAEVGGSPAHADCRCGHVDCPDHQSLSGDSDQSWRRPAVVCQSYRSITCSLVSLAAPVILGRIAGPCLVGDVATDWLCAAADARNPRAAARITAGLWSAPE